jgi:hypothetical protein
MDIFGIHEWSRATGVTPVLHPPADSFSVGQPGHYQTAAAKLTQSVGGLTRGNFPQIP